MKKCELCKGMARMHCDSDQASLCWDCDAKVHSANFLVARHSRNLLCHVCQSPTPWSASGGKLEPTVSMCEHCVDRERCDDMGELEEVIEENQVVPWSPPPPMVSSSSIEEAPTESTSSIEEAVSGRDVVVSRKRLKIDCGSYQSEEDQACKSSRLSDPAGEAMKVSPKRNKNKLKSPLQRTKSGQVEICESHEEETIPGKEMMDSTHTRSDFPFDLNIDINY